MSDPSERRRVHVLAPSPSGVRVDAGGGLPLLDVALQPGETTVAGVLRATATDPTLARPLLELILDEHALDGDGPIPALAVFEPGPVSRHQVGFDEVPLDEGPLARRASMWCDEWAGRAAPSPLRCDWSRPGWWASAVAWIEATGEGFDVGPAELIRHWGISAIVKAGSLWFKAVFPGFAPEIDATTLLAEQAPWAVPAVVGSDPSRRWLLLGDAGGDTFEAIKDDTAAAVGVLTAIQRSFAGRGAELLSLGLPDRRLPTLTTQLAASLHQPDVAAITGIEPAAVDRIVGSVAAAVDAVDSLGLPDVLVHGDFHPGNTIRPAGGSGGPILIDWSDAAFAHPLIDTAIWDWWLDDDPPASRRLWDQVLAAWGDLCDPARARQLLPEIRTVCAAYHAVSYANITIGVEPALRYQHLDGLRYHVTALLPDR